MITIMTFFWVLLIILNVLFILSFVAQGIEIVHSRSWTKLWLEMKMDSTISLLALRDFSLVPWRLRNRWLNCKWLLRLMFLFISYIYRKGNQCADMMVYLGLDIYVLLLWNTAPPLILLM